MARNTNPPKAVKDIVSARSGGICEVCAARPAIQQHHRRPRAAGGSRRASTNAPSNLIDLCLDCHSVIENNREWARDRGLLVRQSHDPAIVPVQLGGHWFLLDDSGGMCESVPAA